MILELISGKLGVKQEFTLDGVCTIHKNIYSLIRTKENVKLLSPPTACFMRREETVKPGENPSKLEENVQNTRQRAT